MRFVSYGDRKKVAAALKAVYTAPNEEAARQALTDFSASDLGGKYPETAATWAWAWERFTPFLAFPSMLRRVISPPLRGRYPLHQRIEAASYQLGKVSKNRGHFPSDEAVSKLLWLAICDTRGQTSPRTRQGERTASIQAQGQGQARRRTDHHRPDTRPWPSPATAYPDRINPYLQNAYTENWTGSAWKASTTIVGVVEQFRQAAKVEPLVVVAGRWHALDRQPERPG